MCTMLGWDEEGRSMERSRCHHVVSSTSLYPPSLCPSRCHTTTATAGRPRNLPSKFSANDPISARASNLPYQLPHRGASGHVVRISSLHPEGAPRPSIPPPLKSYRCPMGKTVTLAGRAIGRARHLLAVGVHETITPGGTEVKQMPRHLRLHGGLFWQRREEARGGWSEGGADRRRSLRARFAPL